MGNTSETCDEDNMKNKLDYTYVRTSKADEVRLLPQPLEFHLYFGFSYLHLKKTGTDSDATQMNGAPYFFRRSADWVR